MAAMFFAVFAVKYEFWSTDIILQLGALFHRSWSLSLLLIMFMIATHCSWPLFLIVSIVPGHVSDSCSLFLNMLLIHIHCCWSCCLFIFLHFMIMLLMHIHCSRPCSWFIFIVPDHVSDSYSLFLIHVPDSYYLILIHVPDYIPDDEINFFIRWNCLSFFLFYLLISSFFLQIRFCF